MNQSALEQDTRKRERKYFPAVGVRLATVPEDNQFISDPWYPESIQFIAAYLTWYLLLGEL